MLFKIHSKGHIWNSTGGADEALGAHLMGCGCTSGRKPAATRTPGHVLGLTCDQEVGEDQEAAAAEADGTVGVSQ